MKFPQKRGAIGKYIFLLSFAALILIGCADQQGQQTNQMVPGGDPDRGRAALQTYGCGTCHTIPGVQNADAAVGPPLDFWSERIYIAGLLNNTPDNLIQWIRNPQAFEPGTAMPDMGVSEEDARDIASYLYTLAR